MLSVVSVSAEVNYTERVSVGSLLKDIAKKGAAVVSVFSFVM